MIIPVLAPPASLGYVVACDEQTRADKRGIGLGVSRYLIVVTRASLNLGAWLHGGGCDLNLTLNQAR
jgi:hypothetical protein